MQLRILAVLLALLVPQPALAWWNAGHMAIAAAAYDKLTPAARSRVDQLLKLNPDYATWVNGVQPADAGRAAFIRASTWADDIKSRPDYKRDKVTSPVAGRNIGYVDKLVHDYWHYYDIPFSVDGTPLEQAEEPNAVTQLVRFSKAMAHPDVSDDIKSYDLVWSIHLIGDAHQPLHGARRFSKQLKGGDRGGNEETVCIAQACDKLHAFWDKLFGADATVAEAQAIAASLPGPDSAAAAVLDPMAWFKESFELAKVYVYTAAIGDGKGPFELDQAYQDNAKKVATQHAALAAARLAGFITSNLR